MRLHIPVLLFGLFYFTLAAHAQTARLDLARKVPPLSCGIPLASVATINGSPAYIRLRFLLAALNSGQDAVIGMASGLDSFKSAPSPTSAFIVLIDRNTSGSRSFTLCCFHYESI
jgi:hypothetical protein